VRKEILDYLKEAGAGCHFREIAENLQKGESNVKGYLTNLVKEGLVVAKGKGVYELVPPPEKVRVN
jgi:DNA-binding IclR family transcriptional regulator